MKILLIQPYSRFFATYPPLGLMYLAAYIREKRKDNIKILDMRTKRMEAKNIFTIISSFKPDVVGISGMSCEFEGINEVARQIKAVSKDITVIVGGAHATTFPEMTLKEGSIDYAVIGGRGVNVTRITRCHRKEDRY